MDKKQVVILLIVTNIVSIGVVALVLSSRSGGQQPVAAEPVSVEPSDTKPPDTAEPAPGVDLDAIIAKYDAVKGGRYAEGMEAYRRAMRKEPPFTAESTIGSTYAANGYYDKALEVCEKQMQINPQNPAIPYTVAWIYAKIGRYEKAIAACQRTIGNFPKYSKIWHIQAWVYATLGEHDKAIEACEQSLKLDPLSADVQYGLGRVYGMLEQYDKAAKAYSDAVRLKADYAEAHLFLGLTYAELGQLDQAKASYREAIRIDKFYAEPGFFLGAACDQSGQYSQAIEAFKQAIENYYMKPTKDRLHAVGIRPDIARAHVIVGVCNLRLKKYFDASRAFKKAIGVDSGRPGAHFGLALAHVLLGEKNEAKEQYEILKGLDEEMAGSLADVIQ
jgi:tetratricopeptide (TPR) repeat protein